jgi:peroxiredoxin
VTDEYFDRVLSHLDRPVTPDAAYAERLFSHLAADTGFRRRRWFGGASRGSSITQAARLAWIGIALVALLAVMTGLLLPGGSPRPLLQSLNDPSSNAEDAQLRPSSGVLEIGVRAPAWTGRLLDGGPFSTDDLLGRPAAILLWCACVSGDQARVFLEEAANRSDLGMVLVSMDAEGTTRGLVDAARSDAPVVLDTQSELLSAWDLSFFPALVLLRADGTVADLQPMTFDAESLSEITDSLAAGGPLPEPAPFPSSLVDADGRQPLSTVLRVGEPAPELVGPRLGGGELSTRDLVGKPTVVLHWLPPRIDGTPQDDEPPADALLDALSERGDALNAVLIAHGEPEPGAAAAYLARRGADVPVIFDWDGTLHQRWGLVMFTTLVLLDAEGHVAGYYGGSALNDPAPLLDTLLAGRPLPSTVPLAR